MDVTKFISNKTGLYYIVCFVSDVHHTVSGSNWRDRKSAAENMSI